MILHMVYVTVKTLDPSKLVILDTSKHVFLNNIDLIYAKTNPLKTSFHKLLVPKYVLTS